LPERVIRGLKKSGKYFRDRRKLTNLCTVGSNQTFGKEFGLVLFLEIPFQLSG